MPDEVAELRAEVERLTQGSAWRERILNFVMAAEADGKVKELIDEHLRMRHQDLCRTEDRYIEVSEALTNANLIVRDGKVFYSEGGEERLLDEVLTGATADR